MRGGALLALLVLGLALVLSCGPQQPPRSPKVDEITALWTQIRQWRREADLPVDPRREDVIQIIGKPVREVQRVCAEGHPVPQTCSEVCSLADAICDNAEQICILADQLGKEDAWAQDKCSSAKASCRDAKKRCCDCSQPKASSAW